ncbi:MAG: hypothetical protein ACRDTT_14295 [Pseudonocardiaceae bacterium]
MKISPSTEVRQMRARCDRASERAGAGDQPAPALRRTRLTVHEHDRFTRVGRPGVELRAADPADGDGTLGNRSE